MNSAGWRAKKGIVTRRHHLTNNNDYIWATKNDQKKDEDGLSKTTWRERRDQTHNVAPHCYFLKIKNQPTKMVTSHNIHNTLHSDTYRRAMVAKSKVTSDTWMTATRFLHSM